MKVIAGKKLNFATESKINNMKKTILTFVLAVVAMTTSFDSITRVSISEQ